MVVERFVVCWLWFGGCGGWEEGGGWRWEEGKGKKERGCVVILGFLTERLAGGRSQLLIRALSREVLACHALPHNHPEIPLEPRQ